MGHQNLRFSSRRTMGAGSVEANRNTMVEIIGAIPERVIYIKVKKILKMAAPGLAGCKKPMSKKKKGKKKGY